MAYIPPHRRPGFILPTTEKALAYKSIGVRFKSTETGLPSHNITLHRFKDGIPVITARSVRKLALKSRKKHKSVLKTRKSKKQLREVKSEGFEKRRGPTLKAKSR